MDHAGKYGMLGIEKKKERAVCFFPGNHSSAGMYGFAIKFQRQVLFAGNGIGTCVYWLLYQK